MRLRSSAALGIRRSTIIGTFAMVAVLCLLSATNASAALSGTYGASSSTTGTVEISGPGAGPYTVSAGGPGFCVGPPLACGSGSGVSGSAAVSPTQISFTFFGSTDGADGSFTVDLTGFTSSISSVAYVSGSLGGGTLSTSFTPSSFTFTESTTSAFDAIGGDTITFDIVATPEPGSVLLLFTAVAGAVFTGRRRRLRKSPSKA